MKETIEVLIQWLDLRLPNWFALIAAAFLGILGVCALSFLLMLFAPDKIMVLMPGVVIFCGISCGYKFWEKRQEDKRLTRTAMYMAAGLITSAAGIILQYKLDNYVFQAKTPHFMILVLLVCGPFGAFLGVWLRNKYEILEQTRTN